jgi:Flp pilus assembly protein TadD
LLAESRQQTGAPEALAALERALQLDPQSASNHAYLGLYWQRQSDFVRAGQSFQRAARLEPQNPIWLMNLGELAFLRGDVPTAHAYYLQATVVAPENDLAWRALALFCLQTEGCLRQDGLPAALKARSLAPEDWNSADVLGQVLMALGEDQSARALLTRAVELAPAEAAPRFHLGLIHLRGGDTFLARENLQAALALDPQGPLAETIRSVMERYLP